MTVSFSIHHQLGLDGSIQKIVMDFLEKLQKNPAHPSLRVKPINGSADPRARTARVNDYYRAVMFELRDGDSQHFVIEGIYPHDKDIAKIKTAILKVNPVNGITELVQTTMPDVEQANAESDSLAKRRAAEREAQLLVEKQALEERAKSESVDYEARKILVPADVLSAAGLTAATLQAELGIPEESTAIVMGLESDDMIDEALSHRPAWERDAFIGLVAGYGFEEVRKNLGMTEPVEGDEDAQLLAGLRTPAAQLEYAYLDGADEDALRRVIESGSFASWRVFIHPDQRDVVERNFSGSGRVFGGAGTGKTVVAVHRANRLATQAQSGSEQTDGGAHPRVLLTTYTRVLADSLKTQMAALNPVYPRAEKPGAPGLWISGIDQLVVAVVSNAHISELEDVTKRILGVGMREVLPLNTQAEDRLWSDAIALAGPELDPGISTPTFLRQEFEAVVLANGITTEREYLRVMRTGRGTPLNRAARKGVWAVFGRFMREMAFEGKVTWPVLAVIGADLLAAAHEATGTRLFDHVVIDEAQDFHAGHWRFLRQLVAEGPNDVFLAEDAHQRIYGQPYVLSRFGISTRGRASKRLTLNYRTTRETLDYAVRILEGEWIDAEGDLDTTAAYRSARSGPSPIVRRFDNELDEIAGVAGLIEKWQEDSAGEARIGVLARTTALVKRAVNGLNEHGLDVAESARVAVDAPIQVMTMHNAKGMEFSHVILLGVGTDVLPQEWQYRGLPDAERQEAIQRERALLYVAASRARDRLVITTHGEPSPLLPRTSPSSVR